MTAVRHRAVGLLGVTAFALVLLAPSAARADGWGSGDPSGDVDGFRYEPEPAPCGTITDLDASSETNEDITRVAVRHTRRVVVVTAHFRDLTSEAEQLFTVNVRTPGGGYVLDLDRPEPATGAWSTEVGLSTEPIYPDPDDVGECGFFGVVSTGIRCRLGHDIGFATDTIRFRVPRTCLGNPRWVRVAAEADHFVNAVDSYDIYSDEWDNHGVELSYWLPPFGPRVRATDGAVIGGGTPHPRSSATERHTVYRHGPEIARP